MRELLRLGSYVMTAHGRDEREADGLSLDDVVRVLLRGRITARQVEMLSGEAEYLVEGRGLGGARTTVVAKLGPTGRLVIITVYLSGSEDEP